MATQLLSQQMLLDKMTSSKNILLVTFSLITSANLVSRSVMAKVGNNDGKDCPNPSGPLIAAILYMITMIYLAVMLFMKRESLKTLHKIMIGLLGLLCLIIFIAYLPFISSTNQEKKSECLTDDNKKAIEYSELILSGVLILFSLVSTFYN